MYISKIIKIIKNQIPTVKRIHHTNTDISKVTLKLLLCLCVLFYSSFVYTCVCVFLHTQSPLRECRSIRSGASRLPYYCAPLVCVPAVLGLLAVWQNNKPKTKNQNKHTSCRTQADFQLFTSWSHPGSCPPRPSII